jgi:hypothetical protein
MVSNESIIDFLLEQTVVIEESPPEAVSLLNLIAHGTHLSIGSYLGYALAGGSIPLMFITVPAGIIVLGAAAGISNGLKNGLQKTVEKYFASNRTKHVLAKAVPAARGRSTLS